jgi:hypothetical protein
MCLFGILCFQTDYELTVNVCSLLSLRPTGSHDASPRAHFSCRWRYRLSFRALSRASSDILGLRSSWGPPSATTTSRQPTISAHLNTAIWNKTNSAFYYSLLHVWSSERSVIGMETPWTSPLFWEGMSCGCERGSGSNFITYYTYNNKPKQAIEPHSLVGQSVRSPPVNWFVKEGADAAGIDAPHRTRYKNVVAPNHILWLNQSNVVRCNL